jgi:hypothetical protein
MNRGNIHHDRRITRIKKNLHFQLFDQTNPISWIGEVTTSLKPNSLKTRLNTLEGEESRFLLQKHHHTLESLTVNAILNGMARLGDKDIPTSHQPAGAD